MNKKLLAFILVTVIIFSAIFTVGGAANPGAQQAPFGEPTVFAVPEPTSGITTRGDINNDGRIDAQDLFYLMGHLANPAQFPVNPIVADINGDGTIAASDRVALQNYLAIRLGVTPAPLPEPEWVTLHNFENDTVGQRPISVNMISGAADNRPSEERYAYPATQERVRGNINNPLNPSSNRAMEVIPVSNVGDGGIRAIPAAGHNPTIGSEPLRITLNPADMQAATDLRVALQIDDNRHREAYVVYIGMRFGAAATYYTRISLEHFFEWGHFYFVGKTFQRQRPGQHRRTFLPDETRLSERTITAENVSQIQQICIWIESYRHPGGNPATPLLVDDIAIFNGPSGYNSSATDPTLRPLAPFTRPEDGGIVVFSFDDGPFRANSHHTAPSRPQGGGTVSNRFTLEYLADIGYEYDARFSFFVVGNRLTEFGASALVPVLNRLLDEGHEIQNHSRTHTHLGNLGTADALLAQIDYVDDWLTNNGLPRTTILRPPMLSVSSLLFNTLSAEQRTQTTRDLVVVGGRDPRDWRGTSVDMRVEFFLQGTQNGSVFILHDQNIDNLEVMRRVIPALQARGFRFEGETVALNEINAAQGGLANARRGSMHHTIQAFRR